MLFALQMYLRRAIGYLLYPMAIGDEVVCKPDLNKRYLAFCLVGPKETVWHEPHKINPNGATISVLNM